MAKLLLNKVLYKYKNGEIVTAGRIKIEDKIMFTFFNQRVGTMIVEQLMIRQSIRPMDGIRFIKTIREIVPYQGSDDLLIDKLVKE